MRIARSLQQAYNQAVSARCGHLATYLEYLRAALAHAEYESTEDGDIYAHIPGLKGLWATGKTKEEAGQELLSALDGWLYVNFWISRTPLPAFDGVDLTEPPQKIE
jgi:predicted RNase H-like HicB family nuclease